MLDASPVAIVTLHSDGTVTGANRAARVLFAWEAPTEDRRFPPAMLQLPQDVASSGAVASRAVSGDGFELTVSAAPMPTVATQDPAVLVVATDVSEQREVERTLLQAQRLEAMGQVAGGIAHDFNNLLTVMIGYTSILSRTVADDASRQFVDHIESRAPRSTSGCRVPPRLLPS